MDNLEVDRMIKELKNIGTQLKRIADLMYADSPADVAEPSPFVEPPMISMEDD